MQSLEWTDLATGQPRRGTYWSPGPTQETVWVIPDERRDGEGHALCLKLLQNGGLVERRVDTKRSSADHQATVMAALENRELVPGSRNPYLDGLPTYGHMLPRGLGGIPRKLQSTVFGVTPAPSVGPLATVRARDNDDDWFVDRRLFGHNGAAAQQACETAVNEHEKWDSTRIAARIIELDLPPNPPDDDGTNDVIQSVVMARFLLDGDRFEWDGEVLTADDNAVLDDSGDVAIVPLDAGGDNACVEIPALQFVRLVDPGPDRCLPGEPARQHHSGDRERADSYDAEVDTLKQSFEFEDCHLCGAGLEAHTFVPDPLGHVQMLCNTQQDHELSPDAARWCPELLVPDCAPPQHRDVGPRGADTVTVLISSQEGGGPGVGGEAVDPQAAMALADSVGAVGSSLVSTIETSIANLTQKGVSGEPIAHFQRMLEAAHTVVSSSAAARGHFQNHARIQEVALADATVGGGAYLGIGQ